MQIRAASGSCDDGDDACWCCAFDDGDHARKPGWLPVPGSKSHYFVEPIAARRPGRAQAESASKPPKGMQSNVSRQLSREKSPVKIFNHRSQRKSAGIAFPAVRITNRSIAWLT